MGAAFNANWEVTQLIAYKTITSTRPVKILNGLQNSRFNYNNSKFSYIGLSVVAELCNNKK